MQLFSQNEESMPDVSAENWFAGSFTYSINNKWKLSFQEQVRFKYTTNPLDRILTQIELENSSKNKKENFQFDWGLAFRHYYKSNEDNFKNQDLFYQIIGNSTFKYEQRINFKNEEKDFLTQTNMLERLENIGASFAYNIKNWKLDPKLGIEFFLRSFDHPSGQHNGIEYP